MEAKANLNVEYLKIDPTILQITENLLNPAWIYNSGRQCYEWAILFLYLPKPQVKIEHLLFVITYVPS